MESPSMRPLSVSSPLIMESYLEKKGALGSKRFWCRLREGKLNYYAKEDKSQMETGSIDISQVQSIRPGRGLTFEIITHSKTHNFTAQDFATRDKWVAGVQEAMMISSRKLSSCRQSSTCSQNAASFDDSNDDAANPDSVFDESAPAPTKPSPHPSSQRSPLASPKLVSSNNLPKTSNPKPWSPLPAKPPTSSPFKSSEVTSPSKLSSGSDSSSLVYEEVRDIKRVAPPGVLSPGAFSQVKSNQSTLYEEISQSVDEDSQSHASSLYAEAKSMENIEEKKAPPVKISPPVKLQAPKAPPPQVPVKQEEVIPPAVDTSVTPILPYEEVLLEPPPLFNDNPEAPLSSNADVEESNDKQEEDEDEEVEDGYSNFDTIDKYRNEEDAAPMEEVAADPEVKVTSDSEVKSDPNGESVANGNILQTKLASEECSHTSENHYSTATPVRMSTIESKEEKALQVQAASLPLMPTPRSNPPTPPRSDSNIVKPLNPKPLFPKPLTTKPKVEPSARMSSSDGGNPLIQATPVLMESSSPPTNKKNASEIGRPTSIANHKSPIVVPPPPLTKPKPLVNRGSTNTSLPNPSSANPSSANSSSANPTSMTQTNLHKTPTRTQSFSPNPSPRAQESAKSQNPAQLSNSSTPKLAMLRNPGFSASIDSPTPNGRDSELQAIECLDLVLDAETRKSPVCELPNPSLEITWRSAFDEIREFLAENGGGFSMEVHAGGRAQKPGEAMAALRRYLNGESL